MAQPILVMQETQVQSLGWEDHLKMEMAIHSSILAWIISWTRSLEGYSPWGWKESHNLATKGTIFHYIYTYICIYIPHLLFIRSSADEHLGCFCVLPIVNSAAIKLGCLHFSKLCIFSGHIPRSGTAGSYESSIFRVFKESLYCSPQWLWDWHIHTATYKIDD